MFRIFEIVSKIKVPCKNKCPGGEPGHSEISLKNALDLVALFECSNLASVISMQAWMRLSAYDYFLQHLHSAMHL